MAVPRLLHTVLDAVEVRREAEFWRELLDLVYRPGDEVPDGPDTADWLVLTRSDGARCLAIQEVDALPPSRWPEPGHPSVSHLDTTVPDRDALDAVHERVLALGGEQRLDRTDDPDEPLRAYASPAGHVFCVFVDPEVRRGATTPAPRPYDAAAGRWSGSADFRLLPTDDFSGGDSMLGVADAARGHALQLSYTWAHPDDGDQAGTLLLGVPAEDGAVSSAWVDSWHQPTPTALAGRIDGTGTVTLDYEYAPGWRWEVEVRVADAVVDLVMRNTVPEQDGEPEHTYDVMLAAWVP